MLKKVIKILEKIEENMLVIGFIVMVAVIFLQVIMRYVFNDSLVWSEELGKFIFVWISWIGISIGHRRKEHIAITMLVDKLPFKGEMICDILTEVIMVAICSVTAYYGILMMKVQEHVPYAAIKISTSWGYLALVIGCIMCSIIALNHICQYIKALKTGVPVEHPETRAGGEV